MTKPLLYANIVLIMPYQALTALYFIGSFQEDCDDHSRAE